MKSSCEPSGDSSMFCSEVLLLVSARACSPLASISHTSLRPLSAASGDGARAIAILPPSAESRYSSTERLPLVICVSAPDATAIFHRCRCLKFSSNAYTSSRTRSRSRSSLVRGSAATKYTVVPSGDHVGALTEVACLVSARGSPPSAGISMNWPSRAKSSVLPSGDQRTTG